MKRALRTTLTLAPLFLLAVIPAQAQMDEPAGNAAMIIWVEPMPGHGLAFEDGVKQHMSNLMEAGDTQTWVVFEVMAGDRTGQYVVGTFNHAWSDFDQPPAVDQAAAQESMAENIFPHVAGVETQLIVRDTDLSMWSPSDPIAPMYQVIEWTVEPGHMPAMQTFMAKVKHAFEQAGGGSYSVFRPVVGGSGSRMTLSIPRQGFASFAGEDPDWFEDMMRGVYGNAETRVLMESVDEAMASESSWMLVFRPDMSMNLPDS